ncbi:MAG: ankyrin repeat domain-containing protein [Candidatus Latescibacterota bacterium]|nr:ankyrin repeat domain-containing protein [Candidatus Latescibacterota bacterium]
MEAKPEWRYKVGSHGRTMLWEAAYKGKLEMVESLAEAGADLDARGCYYTPLRLDITAYCAARVAKREGVAEYLQGRGVVIEMDRAAYLRDAPSRLS